MDTETNEAFGRAHSRIDELIKCVSRTAASQERLTEDIKSLTIATRKALHHSPCRDLCQTKKALDALQQQTKMLIHHDSDSRRDWRRWMLDILKLFVVGTGAGLAVKAAEIWEWIANIKHGH